MVTLFCLSTLAFSSLKHGHFIHFKHCNLLIGKMLQTFISLKDNYHYRHHPRQGLNPEAVLWS